MTKKRMKIFFHCVRQPQFSSYRRSVVEVKHDLLNRVHFGKYNGPKFKIE